MYDANGQISVGILSGNVNSYGDFLGCLSIEDANLHFRGKHCFAELQPFVTESATYLNFLRRLAQSYDLMQSTFNDVSQHHARTKSTNNHSSFHSQPAHIFGLFQTITHGFCIPSSCSHNDVEVAVIYYLESFTNNTGLRFDIRVNEKMCQVRDKVGGKPLDQGEILTM